jgi:hypothetical protein
MLLFLYHKINKTILMSKIVQKFWVSFGGVFDECMRKPKKHIKLIELLKPENKANLGGEKGERKEEGKFTDQEKWLRK